MKNVNYAKFEKTKEDALKRAEKFRRGDTFWQKGKKSAAYSGDYSGSGTGFAALRIVFFPITYPLYLLFNQRFQMEFVKLVLWPFFDIELQFSSDRGIQKQNIWVEGIRDGLSQGISKDGIAIWGTVYDMAQPHNEPFVAHPEKHLRVKQITNDDIKEQDIAILPYYYYEDQAIDYIMQGAEQVIRGNYNIWSAFQFMNSFKSIYQVRKINVSKTQEVYYPVWLVKYKGKKAERVTLFSPISRSVLDRIDMSNAVLQNEDIYKCIFK